MAANGGKGRPKCKGGGVLDLWDVEGTKPEMLHIDVKSLEL